MSQIKIPAANMRRFVGTAVFLLVMLLPLGDALAQEEVEGGSFTWKGEECRISASEISRNMKIVTILNPGVSEADRLHLAWSRAIRLACARLENIQVDPKKFAAWMKKRHRALATSLAQSVDPDRALTAWLNEKGFEDIKAYETLCREEYLGELFTALEFPEVESDESQLRQHFNRMFTAYDVSTLVFAPETLDETPALDMSDPAAKKLFESWWNSLSEHQKRIMDDRDRPAIAAEVLYFTFQDKSISELREFFEKDRPNLGGSFASLTSHYKLTTKDLTKMAVRWQKKRLSTMLHWNGEIPAGSSEAEAFAFIKPHLERVWRLIKYLGEAWKKLSAEDGPTDFKAAARRWGFSYRHIPLTPTRILMSDKELPGDHPLYMRRTKPGQVYSYTSMGETPGSLYYVNGVVDQPGLHAGIWKLIQAEEMRVRPALEMMDQVWDRFLRENSWRLAHDHAKAFERELARQMKEHIAGLKGSSDWDTKERLKAEREFARNRFRLFFSQDQQTVRHARVLPPFFVRPFEGRKRSPNYEGPLGIRVANYLNMGWALIVGGQDVVLQEGQVIPMAFSNDRHLAVLTRINHIYPPSDRRWEIDAAGRQAAREDLEHRARQNRRTRVTMAYAFPNIVHKFKLQAPQYVRIMSRALMGKMSSEGTIPQQTEGK